MGRTRPLEHEQVTTMSCVHASPLVPRAAIGAQPLQHAQVTTISSKCAGQRIPETAIGTRPLYRSEMTVMRCVSARVPVPWTAVGTRPLQHQQVTTVCCVSARLLGPRAAIGARPLQHGQVTSTSGKWEVTTSNCRLEAGGGPGRTRCRWRRLQSACCRRRRPSRSIGLPLNSLSIDTPSVFIKAKGVARPRTEAKRQVDNPPARPLVSR